MVDQLLAQFGFRRLVLSSLATSSVIFRRWWNTREPSVDLATSRGPISSMQPGRHRVPPSFYVVLSQLQVIIHYHMDLFPPIFAKYRFRSLPTTGCVHPKIFTFISSPSRSGHRGGQINSPPTPLPTACSGTRGKRQAIQILVSDRCFI